MLSDILHPDLEAAFASALADAEAPPPAGVIGPDGLPAPKRFNVYRNNVMVSLIEALAQTFPAIERLVGAEYFKALARVFIAERPPRSPVLLWYGGGFADFIANFPPLGRYPYLADVARLEWAWLQAYHAADAAPLEPQALATVAPERLDEVRFTLHPAAGVVASDWPVLALVLANRFAIDDAPAVDLDEAEAVLVTRPDLDVRLQRLRPGAATFLGALRTLPLTQAAEIAAAAAPAFDLAASLADILGAGAFTGFAFDAKAKDRTVE